MRGAFLVAVLDPVCDDFPAEAASSVSVPAGHLRFPAQMLASTDDPYSSVSYAKQRADEWGCGLMALGPLGRIDGASRLGAWPRCRLALESFVGRLG